MKKIYFIIAFILFGTSDLLFAQQPIKKVLLEEFTTASCGNCPMMSKYVGDWHNNNAAHTVLVSIHEGSGNDAMSNALTDTIFNAMHPTGSWFAPAMMINRGVYPSTNGEAYLSCYQSWGSGTGPGVDSIATRLINEPAKVGVEINGTYNSATRTINATVQATFADTVSSGNWRIALYLVEDSVIGYPNLGPFQGWDQHCYDANWANTNYPGMFDGTSIIGYPHRHVLRQSLLTAWGAAGIIPQNPVIGTVYSASATKVVDTAYHENQLSLVAIVASYGSNKTMKYILNANEVKLTPVFTTAVNEMAHTDKMQLNIFPNPATNEINISYQLQNKSDVKIGITDICGRQIYERTITNQAAGQYEFSTSTESLSKGIYFVKVNTNRSCTTQNFIRQ